MDLVTNNVYLRVAQIFSGSGFGTAFTFEHADRQWLVTASHVLPVGETKPIVRLRLPYRNDELTLQLDLLDVQPPNADIAVSHLHGPITHSLSLPATSEGLIWSQQLFFLGFPYGLATESADTRLAFVKSGILSARSEVEDAKLIYIDGFNNPGFSGGPVVFCRDGDNQRPQIAGVISGYRFEHLPVYQGDAEVPAITARVNTGIVIATDIWHAIQAIENI